MWSMESSPVSLESSPALLRRSYKNFRAYAELCPNIHFFHRINGQLLQFNNPLVSSEYFLYIIAIMLSILARILFIMAYGVLGLDRLHNCLRLHDTGFVMSCLRFFVRPLFVLLCHNCFLLSRIAMLSVAPCHRFAFVTWTQPSKWQRCVFIDFGLRLSLHPGIGLSARNL